MLLLKDDNVYLYELANEKQQKVVRKYMKFVYYSITPYTMYDEFETIINNANYRVYKYFKNEHKQRPPTRPTVLVEKASRPLFTMLKW